MTDRSDADLLDACGRDPEAFRELYRRLAPALLAYLRRSTDSAETALDLLAETFALAYEQRRRYDGRRGPVAAWLFGIARNQVRRYYRHRTAERAALRRLGVDVAPLDAESLERIEELVDSGAERSCLARALHALRPEDRQVLELRIVQEKDYEDVAAQLSCSVGTARVRVHRALARLATQMEMS